MKDVFGFDPSSTCIGYARCPSNGMPHPVDSGTISRPASWNAYFRIRSMRLDVEKIIMLHRDHIERIVIEVPGRKQAGSKRNEYATPGAYAAAVGMVLSESLRLFDGPVVTVDSDHWTRLGGGFGVKKSRRLAGLEAVSGYDRTKDAGGDEGDAIYIASWYARNHMIEGEKECLLHLPQPNAILEPRRAYSSANVVTRSGGELVTKGSTWKP